MKEHEEDEQISVMNRIPLHNRIPIWEKKSYPPLEPFIIIRELINR